MSLFKFFKSNQKVNSKNDLKKYYRTQRTGIWLILIYGYTCAYFIRDLIKVSNTTFDFLKDNSKYALFTATFAFAYGLSKFILGLVTDRKNSRIVFSGGIYLSIISNFGFFLIGACVTNNFIIYPIQLFFLILVAVGQGLCAPTVYKIFANWWRRNERGTWISIYNTAHNLGAGILIFIFSFSLQWFSFKGQVIPEVAGQIISILLGLIACFLIIFFLSDSPQQKGLPSPYSYHKLLKSSNNKVNFSLQQHKNNKRERNKKISYKQSLKNVLINKYIWLACLVNGFGYLLRFIPTIWLLKYLQTFPEINENDTKLAYALFELGAVPGTIFLGWLSDRFLKKRGLFPTISLVAMIPFMLIFNLSRKIILIQLALFFLGFFIYTPLNFTNSIMVLDVIPKKNAGVGTGFVGFSGYLFIFLVQIFFTIYEIDKGRGDFSLLFVILWISLFLNIILSFFAFLQWKKRFSLTKED